MLISKPNREDPSFIWNSIISADPSFISCTSDTIAFLIYFRTLDTVSSLGDIIPSISKLGITGWYLSSFNNIFKLLVF